MEAELSCTFEKFEWLLDYRIRKRIQIETKPLKKKHENKCTKSGNYPVNLHAAHPVDNSRRTIIKRVLLRHVLNGKLVINDLAQIEEEIWNEHKSPETFFRFICQKCHQEEHR